MACTSNATCCSPSTRRVWLPTRVIGTNGPRPWVRSCRRMVRTRITAGSPVAVRDLHPAGNSATHESERSHGDSADADGALDHWAARPDPSDGGWPAGERACAAGELARSGQDTCRKEHGEEPRYRDAPDPVHA